MTDDPALKLHLAEYTALRAEILSQQAVRQQTFQLGVAAIVAIWAFLLSETIKPDLLLMNIAAWWLPVPVAAAGLVMNYAAAKGVKQAGAYLAMIEEKYADTDLRGWENTLIYMREPARQAALKEKGEKSDLWPDHATPSDPVLARLHRAIKEREIASGYSRVIRFLWGIILSITIGVAVLASILIYATSIT